MNHRDQELDELLEPLRGEKPHDLQLARWRRIFVKKQFGWPQLLAAAVVGFILGAAFFGFNERGFKDTDQNNFSTDATIVRVYANQD